MPKRPAPREEVEDDAVDVNAVVQTAAPAVEARDGTHSAARQCIAADAATDCRRRWSATSARTRRALPARGRRSTRCLRKRKRCRRRALTRAHSACAVARETLTRCALRLCAAQRETMAPPAQYAERKVVCARCYALEHYGCALALPGRAWQAAAAAAHADAAAPAAA